MPCLYIGRTRRRLLSARGKRGFRAAAQGWFSAAAEPRLPPVSVRLRSRGSLLFPLIVSGLCIL